MTKFDDLPTDIRNKIMYHRAHANYKKAMSNTIGWGVRYKNGFRFEYKNWVLKDECRKLGLRVSGTKTQLLFRIRDHTRDALRRKCDNSFRFWAPIVL